MAADGPNKIALITGGTSGIGLEVARLLLSQGWTVYVMNRNAAAGAALAQSSPGLKFIQVDVTSWASLSAAFHAAYEAEGRIDFVFANAGVVQMDDFYELDAALPPAEPSQPSIDINLKAVVNTFYLAWHYFRASEKRAGQDPVLIATGSICSFYSQEFIPLYTASKAGLLGFIRSVATPYHNEGIRTYALCPSTIRTDLLSKGVIEAYPEEYLTPMATIVSTVDKLIKGGELVDGNGRKVAEQDNYGLAVEVICDDFYVRDQVEYVNEGVRQICEAGSLSNQKANLTKRTK